MDKLDMAYFLARISFRKGKNTLHGETVAEWTSYYLTFTHAELKSEVASYGC